MKRAVMPPAIGVATVAVALVCSMATSQTMIDLKSQAKNIDFSRVGSTRPFSVGGVLPTTCSVGQTYFKEDARPGENLFLCTAANIWAAIATTGQAGGSIPTQSGDAGKLLGTDGTSPTWRAVVGFTDDGSRFVPDDTVLSKLAGNNVWTGHQRFPASPTQTLDAANDVIACNRYTIAISATTALALSSTPTVLDGADGQICVITNVGANSVTLQHQSTLASSNLQLSTERVTIPPKGRVTLQYSAAIGDWIQEINTGTPAGMMGLQDTNAAGIVAQTGSSGVTAARTITGTNGIAVVNGDGILGDPTISMPGSSKGDLIVYEESGNTRLASGTNGQVLTADATDAKGLKWTSRTVAGANGLAVTNGDWSTGAVATIALPGSAKGDVIVHNGSSNTHIPVGTNGQVLTADATDAKGLKWTSRTVAGANGLAITNGDWSTGAVATIALPGSAKGDVIVHNGSSNTHIPVGTNGQVLTADATDAKGLKWTSRTVAGANGLAITNGDWSTGAVATIALPGSAKGDVIVHNGSSNTHIPVGTNGQVLTADATDAKGLKWTSRTVAGANGLAITNGDWSTGAVATITLPGSAKGDIIVHDGSSNTHIPVGTNGQVLTVDSAQTMGLKWVTPQSAANAQPIDPTSIAMLSYLIFKDEFSCASASSTTTSAIWGDLKWRKNDSIGTAAVQCLASDNAMPANIRITTGTTAGANHQLYFGANGQSLLPNLGVGGPFAAVGSEPAWKFVFRFRTDASSTTDHNIFAGMQSQVGSAPTGNAIGLFFDSEGTPSGLCDTGTVAKGNFGFVNNASGTGRCQDSGLAVAANTIYTLEVWSDVLGTVNFRLNGGSTFTQTGPPSTTMLPMIGFGNSASGATARTVDIDYFAFIGRGLSR